MRRARWVLAAVLVTLLSWATTAPASAHVLLDTVVPVGDGSVEITLTFDHSCTDSPTVEIAVEMPDGAELVSGTGPEGWTTAIQGTRIVFSGPGIGDRQNPQFQFVARLAGSVGQSLLFPTRQTCADGNGYDWSDPSESTERPAPRLVATEATLAEVTSGSAATPAPLPENGANAWQLTAALVGLAVVVYGTARVFALRRR